MTRYLVSLILGGALSCTQVTYPRGEPITSYDPKAIVCLEDAWYHTFGSEPNLDYWHYYSVLFVATREEMYREICFSAARECYRDDSKTVYILEGLSDHDTRALLIHGLIHAFAQDTNHNNDRNHYNPLLWGEGVEQYAREQCYDLTYEVDSKR